MVRFLDGIVDRDHLNCLTQFVGANAWIHQRDFKTPFANGCE